jgi:hypothetical protein
MKTRRVEHLDHGPGDQDLSDGLVPGVGQVGLQVLQGAGSGVSNRLNHEAQESNQCEATVLDLLHLQLLQVGALREAQGVERATRVLPLLGVGLTVPLRLVEGKGEELYGQDDREVAPRHWVAQVGGLATGGRGPLLCRHPVAVAEGLRDQHSGLRKTHPQSDLWNFRFKARHNRVAMQEREVTFV